MPASSTFEWPAVLSIAGSDSGGGAGIQADLKTFESFSVYGTTAITCVTAQNPAGVQGIQPMGADFVADQIRTVCEGFPIAAAKTGMLYSTEIIRAVAQAVVRQGVPVLVVDPVMVASSGAQLLRSDAIEALCSDLLPHARVITPNAHEAEILWGHPVRSVDDLKAAARDICERYDVACIAKGGHLPGEEVIDVLFDEGQEWVFKAPRILADETHGCGCSFSAALTACLARGKHLGEAFALAKKYVAASMKHAPSVGRHRPLMFHRRGDD